jgi:hypothetical protein
MIYDFGKKIEIVTVIESYLECMEHPWEPSKKFRLK